MDTDEERDVLEAAGLRKQNKDCVHARQQQAVAAREPGAGSKRVKVEATPSLKLGQRLFVVHMHNASNLHYDLRLELGGQMHSWAVPKGPSCVLHERRLAVRVGVHPSEYASFEGRIADGRYGAGEVLVWDHGTWEILERPGGDVSDDVALDSLRQGSLKFRLAGHKLRGRWCLIRTSGKHDKHWLLFREQDGPDDLAASQWPSGRDILKEEPRSVLSQRLMDDLCKDPNLIEIQGCQEWADAVKAE